MVQLYFTHIVWGKLYEKVILATLPKHSSRRAHIRQKGEHLFLGNCFADWAVSVSFLFSSHYLSLSVFFLFSHTQTCTHTPTESMYLLQHREDRLEPSPDLTVLLICCGLISPGEAVCCSRRELRKPRLKLPTVEQNISEIYLTISLARWLP